MSSIDMTIFQAVTCLDMFSFFLCVHNSLPLYSQIKLAEIWGGVFSVFCFVHSGGGFFKMNGT